ncbi:MAG: hypothetical protein QOE45_1091 [Frankiaceae bacterium]|jgi:nucleoside-diphosphate-sugar epimerase|nr:hypothetical protein [Frankiaceae bacterium]
MRALVTGAAGFIGSHLSQRLVREGWEVVGVDALTGYYSPELKRRNLAHLDGTGFTFVEADVLDLSLAEMGAPFDVVFHQAAQPGVRASWSEFPGYVRHNLVATQHLLESCLHSGVGRVVHASSSSVYGEALAPRLAEDALPRPRSPYGVTKRAGEHLIEVYRDNFGLPAVALRYFTVYGPRQRPDMAFSRLLATRLGAPPVPIFGDGEQSRDFTYVDDVVEANWLAAQPGSEPGTYNVAGGSEATVNEVLKLMTAITGGAPDTVTQEAAAGDVRRTSGLTDAARDRLGWSPKVGLEDGLRRQWEWLMGLPAEALAHYSDRS